MHILINAALGGAIAGLFASTGAAMDTWKFWAGMACLFALIVNSVVYGGKI